MFDSCPPVSDPEANSRNERTAPTASDKSLTPVPREAKVDREDCKTARDLRDRIGVPESVQAIHCMRDGLY